MFGVLGSFGGFIERFAREEEQQYTISEETCRRADEREIVGCGGEETSHRGTQRERGVVGDTVDGVRVGPLFGGDHVCEHRVRPDLVHGIRKPDHDHDPGELPIGLGMHQQVIGDAGHDETEVHHTLAPDTVGEGACDQGRSQPCPGVDGDQ